MSMYDNAIAELSDQRDFLLSNQWRKGDPLDQAYGMDPDEIGGEEGGRGGIGCLVDRVVCVVERVSSLGSLNDEEYLEVVAEMISGVYDPIAVRAILWTLAENGYRTEIKTFLPLLPERQESESDEDFLARRQEADESSQRESAMVVNDLQFDSPGEALGVLEASILLLKSLREEGLEAEMREAMPELFEDDLVEAN